jgi:hypothetical protein
MKELPENEKYWSKEQSNHSSSNDSHDKPKFKKPFFKKK